MTDYLDEIRARADAASERAIREAAEPAIQAWADAVWKRLREETP